MNKKQGQDVHHGEYGQNYCNNFVWRQMVIGLDPFVMRKNIQLIFCRTESNIIL